MAELTRGDGLLSKDTTGLVIIDVQEGFRPVIDAFDDVVLYQPGSKPDYLPGLLGIALEAVRLD